jgi:hypothetical protein
MTEQAKLKECPIVFANAVYPNLYNFCGSNKLQKNVRINIVEDKICVVTTKHIASNYEILFDGKEIYVTFLN